MCVLRGGMSTRPDNHITLFQYTRQSARLDAATTPVDKDQVNYCVQKIYSLREVSNKEIANKKPEMLSPTRY